MWEAVALVFLHRTTVELYGLPVGWKMALAVALTAFWTGLCVRLVRMGLFVGRGGVQIRGLVTRRTVQWREVERIVVDRVNQQWLGFRVPAGKTAVIELRDGTRVSSSLWANGMDFKFGPARFGQVCDDLRRALIVAREQEEAALAASH